MKERTVEYILEPRTENAYRSNPQYYVEKMFLMFAICVSRLRRGGVRYNARAVYVQLSKAGSVNCR